MQKISPAGGNFLRVRTASPGRRATVPGATTIEVDVETETETDADADADADAEATRRHAPRPFLTTSMAGEPFFATHRLVSWAAALRRARR